VGRHLIAWLLLGSAWQVAPAAPACARAGAENFVVANVSGNLSDGFGGDLLLQSTGSTDHILMHRCSGRQGSSCYFAVNVAAGRYYFREVVTGAKNGLVYPVSGSGLWFEVTGQGVDYIGDWTIVRGDSRQVHNLQIEYRLRALDDIVSLCQTGSKRLFLDKTNAAAAEIVD